MRNYPGDATIELLAGNGIDIQNNNISVKIDNSTLEFDTQGRLKTKINVIGSEEGNPNILQVILKDVVAGTKYEISSENINHKSIVQYYKLENEKQVEVSISNFNLDIENILSSEGIKIQNLYNLNIVNGESEIINKDNFVKILKITGGM